MAMAKKNLKNKQITEYPTMELLPGHSATWLVSGSTPFHGRFAPGPFAWCSSISTRRAKAFSLQMGQQR
ncbi:hypothetical protein M413DRAFT_119713 [Hebeloma cylindrosporum]|uniref:Uncharacterized protein n=1 Tax=Hebeloma cylindrosporum TaxID=76867 RepID=A0A0C2YNE4_HEBCY|nr:hypothetical protein M413DRAFT_119713 [Hebeloma cylindrosporum h7]